MRPDSLSGRLIGSAALWSAAVLLIAGFLLSSIFEDAVERAFDARLGFLLEALVATAEIDPEGELSQSRPLSETRFELPFSGWYWQISPPPQASPGASAPLRSRSLWDQTLPLMPGGAEDASDELAQKFGYLSGPEGQRLRAIQREIRLVDAEDVYVFTVAGDSGEIEREVAGFNNALFVALGVLGAGLLAGLLVQVRFGLRPLDRARAALSAIRNGRAERLDGPFPSEVEPLAEELNSLLDHNQEVIERARTHVGNLAHALKTPLSVLTNEARQSRGPDPQNVSRQIQLMRDQIDRHLSRARTAASAHVLGVRTEVEPILASLVRTLKRIHEGKNIRTAVSCPAHLAFRGERQDLEEIAGNLLDNAFKWAGSEVRVTVDADDDASARQGTFTLTIEDDGPGLPADKRDAVLQRGMRLDESIPGSGLGLSIVGEIVALYRGSLGLEVSELGGLKVRVTLPKAPESGQSR